MFRQAILMLVFAGAPSATVVIDRIAVIVGNHVIKASDIDRDLRVTEFLNRAPLDLAKDARRKAAERLIDQTIIRDEMEKGEYARSSPADVDAMVQRLRQEHFSGSDARMKQGLAAYGLTEEQLRLELQWQLDVLKFIDERFRPGVMVTDEEVQSYYDQHQAELRRDYPQAKTFETLAPKIRASLEGQRLNQNFEQWLATLRKQTRIEYRQGAFQ